MTRYAEILLPLTMDLLTYEIPDSDDFASLSEGEGVAVEMGANGTKFYTGIVWQIHTTRPDYKVIRKVLKRLYITELLSAEHRRFWGWLADYYMCSLGEVMRVALPALIKPCGADEEAFALAEYRPARELYIGVVNPPDEGQIEKIERRSQAQADALREILATEYRNDFGEVARRLIRCEKKHLNSLVTKGIISLTERDRSAESKSNIGFILPPLTQHQQEALGEIKRGYEERQCCLLHGVTGSGKTEVYMHLIAEQLREGRDVLMLVPEIALTTQLIERMTLILGSRVTAYHSKVPPRRRTELFMELAQSREGGNFIVGARSALFLPLRHLGLVIVDEEHDSSYKQIDPAPRYNARDSAHILAQIFGAKVLLGSATPSLESWTNATTGKFAMARLTQRYGDAQMPTIVVSDTRRAGRRRERRGHFNLDLVKGIEERVERGEQVMLFQNRRGFAPYVECAECGWVARCPNCNVSLTMHKGGGSLRCHYCDYAIPIPTRCPSCTVGEVLPMGFGTEKIEEQIAEFVPKARTIRMDRDTANSPTSLERIIGSFVRYESDVMVGTQMIAKGFDFSRVTLVGILNADNMLLTPDFRAEERAFALIQQVAGRAGRRGGVDAEVIIQTTQPEHRVIKYVVDDDYESMARVLLSEREAFGYPPYSRITMINLRHKDRDRLYRGAGVLSQLLRGRFGRRVKGPVPPPVDRIMGDWLLCFMVRIESGASSARARVVLREVMAQWCENKEFGSINVSFNVDPQ